MIFLNKKLGFSLIELILAIGIFSILTGSLTIFSLDAYRASYNSQKRIEAGLIIQEVSNAVLALKNQNWRHLVENADGTVKHLTFSNNSYTFTNGSTNLNGFTIEVAANTVSRDTNGNIVQSGGTIDPRSRIVNILISWKDNFNRDQALSTNLYINDWSSLIWRQTTQADFNAGTKTNVTVANTEGGEVQLATIVYADWCGPSNTLTNFDLPGQGIAQTISAISGRAYIGTGSNASGLAFARVDVTYDEPPVPSLNGTYDGNKVNMVFGDASYGYLTTDTNSEEVVILNISSTPYTKVGYFDAAGTGNGGAIFAIGNYGYMTQDNVFRIFDLSSKTGSRSVLGSVNLSGTGKKIFVSGNYAYVVTDSTSNQLQIIDISVPSTPTIVSNTTIGSIRGSSLFVNADTSRVYYISENNSTGVEFYILNTVTKTGSRSIIGSAELNGMSPIGVTSVESANRVIIVGSNGQEYQVFNTVNESSPFRCGGLDINTTIYDVNTVYEPDGDAYSYIITGESNAELKLIKGGPGGGFGNGQGYAKTGEFTSQIFDTTSSLTSYFVHTPTATVPTNSTLRAQIRSSNDLASISSTTFTGPNGTSSTFYSSVSSETINSAISSKRYIQFKYFFTSDSVVTPVLKGVDISYQK